MAMTPDNPESNGNTGASRPFKFALLGIFVSVLAATIALQIGLSNIGVVVLLISGMCFSAVGACVLDMGPRYTLLEVFSIFIVISVELGVLLNFSRLGQMFGIGPTFLGSLLFGIYGILLGFKMSRRFSGRSAVSIERKSDFPKDS